MVYIQVYDIYTIIQKMSQHGLSTWMIWWNIQFCKINANLITISIETNKSILIKRPRKLPTDKPRNVTILRIRKHSSLQKQIFCYTTHAEIPFYFIQISSEKKICAHVYFIMNLCGKVFQAFSVTKFQLLLFCDHNLINTSKNMSVSNFQRKFIFRWLNHFISTSIEYINSSTEQTR